MPSQKVWPIRMPEDLLEELKERAKIYELPVQTFTKYVLRQGLEHEKLVGLLVDKSEEIALISHKRKVLVRAQKEGATEPKPRRRRRKQEESPPEEAKEAPSTEPFAELSGPVEVLSPAEVEAMIGGDSSVVAEAEVQRATAEPEAAEPEDILADMGVLDAPPAPVGEPSFEDELDALLSTV